jgi:putative acetyltransferase
VVALREVVGLAAPIPETCPPGEGTACSGRTPPLRAPERRCHDPRVRIVVADLSVPGIADLLSEHMSDMRATSPPESIHALDLEGLRQASVTLWCVRDGTELVAVGALKELDPAHGEVKSMRTSGRHRGRGIASKLLQHIIDEAGRRGMSRLSLETGSQLFFAPARALYARHGFVPCGAFGDYTDDPNSVYMTRDVSPMPSSTK